MVLLKSLPGSYARTVPDATGPLHHDPRGGCWMCADFGRQWERFHIVCLHGNAPHIKPSPDAGCAFWMRESGADDEVHFDRTRRCMS